MKNVAKFIVVCLVILITRAGYPQSVIFLHHSTGSNVYTEGSVASWIADYNAGNGTSYVITERAYPTDPYGWSNYPYDYWNLWLNGACNNSNVNIECLDGLCASYDVIIFKHCFPGASVVEDIPSPDVSSAVKCLANYKLQYRALRDLMDSYPDNKFIVWTLAPLHRLTTTVENAARAREFVDWVKNEWLTEDGEEHPNIYIFDFFGLVAETDPDPEYGQVNCLKYDYERDHESSDSHPNTLANQTVGPIFARFIVNTIEDAEPIPVTGITVSGEGGATTITTAEGTLQLIATITPEDATTKAVTWSITNGTGEATISETGLVTAVTNGTVTATVTSVSNPDISNSLTITIAVVTQTDLVLTETINGFSVDQSNLIIHFKENIPYNKLQIFDLTGHTLINKRIDHNPFRLNISRLISGMYVIKLCGHSGQLDKLKFSKP